MIELARRKKRQKAVIFDVDGTLSSMAWRVHYLDEGPDWSAFHSGMVLDRPIEAMVGAARAYRDKGYRVIALTLRPERFRQATEEWFSTHDVPFDDMYLRPPGDYRDGAIVKREIYETKIKPNYDVEMTFDDYPKMNAMWESANLPSTRVYDPGHRPLVGQPAVDPRSQGAFPTHVSQVADTTPKEEAGSAYSTGDDLRHGGTITPEGHLDLGPDHRLRTWIPPHPSVTEDGHPYRVRGHWRRLNRRGSKVKLSDGTREMFWLRVRGEDPADQRSRGGVSRLRSALQGGAGAGDRSDQREPGR